MPWYYYQPEPGTTYSWMWSGTFTYVSVQGTSIITLKAPASIANAQNSWVVGRANNSCGSGPMSQAKYLSYAVCSGGFTVSPNPATSQIIVQADELTLQTNVAPDIQAVEIIDKMGVMSLRKQFGKGMSKVSISISELKNDIYTIKIFDGKQWHVQKLVVQH